MKTPNKHAALIHAWADGAQIECETRPGKWVLNGPPGDSEHQPGWFPEFNYRISTKTHPTHCPYCASTDTREITDWTATAEDDDNNTVTLTEYQCQKCEGRSYWA